MVGADDAAVTKALRSAGLGLLAVVVVIDAFAPIVTCVRRAAATKAINVVDHVAPTENFLPDAGTRPSADERSSALDSCRSTPGWFDASVARYQRWGRAGCAWKTSMSPVVLPDRRARQPDEHDDDMGVEWRLKVRPLT